MQKSLFEKFTKLFQQNKNGGSKLSATAANNAQSAYIASNCKNKEPLSAPYLEIAKQLSAAKPEIFFAALYYLKRIADNNPIKANDIITAINTVLSAKNKISSQRKTLIKEAINTIEKTISR